MDLRIRVRDENDQLMLDAVIYEDGSDAEATERIRRFLEETFESTEVRHLEVPILPETIPVSEPESTSKKETYRVPCIWRMCGFFECEASSWKDALEQAVNGDLPVPGTYVEDSFDVDREYFEEVAKSDQVREGLPSKEELSKIPRACVMSEDQMNMISGLMETYLEHTDLENIYHQNGKGHGTYTMKQAIEEFPFLGDTLKEQMLYRMPKEKDLECHNCGARFHEDDLERVFPNIPDLTERIEPGGTVPAGECAECGFLVFPMEEEDDS